ncbi:hypothetical protein ABEB36_008431 [Hypothenemus hampei]
MEEKDLIGRKTERSRRFKAHPKLIKSDTDTTASCSPRFQPIFSLSNTNLSGQTSLYQLGFQDTKKRAENFHKFLHEKLSTIDSSRSQGRCETNQIGDSCKIVADDCYKYREKSLHSDSSIGSLSDSELEYSNALSKSIEFKKRNGTDRAKSSFSINKRTISERERRSADSGLTSQSYCPKGMPMSIFEKKFKTVVTKSLKNLSEIREILEKGILPPDGEEDKSRRLARAKGFSNIFSRNYLYPLARQLKDLKLLNQLNPLLTNQKLLTTYQVIHNALQAYRNHLPTTILGPCTYSNLKVLMSYIVDISGKHNEYMTKIQDAYIEEFVDTFKINAQLLIQKVDDCGTMQQNPGCKSDQSKISLSKFTDNKQKSNVSNPEKKNNINKRLSMYTVTASFRKDPTWKKTMEHMAKKKFNVQSKYKTATFKHRPPIQKELDFCSNVKTKTVSTVKSPGRLRLSRLSLPLNEDCIKTLIGTEHEGENHQEKEDLENMEKNNIEEVACNSKEEIILKLIQLTLKAQNNQTLSEEDNLQMSQLYSMVNNEENMKYFKKIIEEMSNKIETKKEMEETKQELTLEIVKSHYSLSDGFLGSNDNIKRKEPKISITGEKNVKLICITDDNSIDEHSELDKSVIEPVAKKSSETQTDKKNTIGTQKGRKAPNIKISRLKKSERCLPFLDKTLTMGIIQYKLEFYRYSKSNPLYKRSTACQPWILMNKISEKLLDDSLIAVAREIEVNDIVNQVFQAEMQT